MKRHTTQRNCIAEFLERRRLLAGNVLVSVAAGDVIVRGDVSDNAIEITQEEADALHIEGVDDTTVNGAEFIDVPDIDDLRIVMVQGGEDDIAIRGEIDIPGRLRVRMGEGALTIDGSAGPVTIGQDLLITSAGDVAILNDVAVDGSTRITADGQVNVVAGLAVIPDFSSAAFDEPLTIDNPYLPWVPGTVYTYESTTVDEETGETQTEVTVVEVLSSTRTILGVETREVRDTVTVDGLLVEDTIDRFAQDNDGNVWYFGETVTNYVYDETGTLVETNDEGSFEAGVDGAMAGIVMEANPQIGDRYYQEVAPGEALDQAEVLALDDSATVPAGEFDDLLRTEETTVLEPDALEHKLYAPGIGLVLEEGIDPQTGEVTGVNELISVELNGAPVTEVVPPGPFEGTNAIGEVTQPVRLTGRTSVTADDSIIARGVVFDDVTTLLTDADLTVRASVFSDRLITRAEGTTSLNEVLVEDRARLGSADLYIFDSQFDERLQVLLGSDDDTFAVEGSEFTQLRADGGRGENTFEDNGDNTFEDLVLKRFETEADV